MGIRLLVIHSLRRITKVPSGVNFSSAIKNEDLCASIFNDIKRTITKKKEKEKKIMP